MTLTKCVIAFKVSGAQSETCHHPFKYVIGAMYMLIISNLLLQTQLELVTKISLTVQLPKSKCSPWPASVITIKYEITLTISYLKRLLWSYAA